jgi:predicted lipoprotein with Yx(FWY)xxD motif
MKRVALLIAVSVLAGLGASAIAAGRGPLATVGTRHSPLGTFLVSAGRTLYLFEADGRNQSSCSGPCAGTWPALLTGGHPKATAGVKASLLGTVARGSAEQVTYNGHRSTPTAATLGPGRRTARASSSSAPSGTS